VARRGDVGILKLKAVVRGSTSRLIRESGRVKYPVQDVAGTIACEHASRPICSMRSRRQSEDQQPRIGVSERRHGSSPVGLIAVSAAFGNGDGLAMRNEPGAAPAAGNIAVKFFDGCQKPVGWWARDDSNIRPLPCQGSALTN
jgi:hypothetical protein